MRVVVAPDKFAGTLTAVEAAEAIAAGGARRAPDDELDRCRCRTAGPGSSTYCTRRWAASCSRSTVTGPYGDPVPATVLRVGDDGVRRERPGRAGCT